MLLKRACKLLAFHKPPVGETLSSHTSTGSLLTFHTSAADSVILRTSSAPKRFSPRETSAPTQISARQSLALASNACSATLLIARQHFWRSLGSRACLFPVWRVNRV